MRVRFPSPAPISPLIRRVGLIWGIFRARSSSVQRMKRFVAIVLALVWLPAVSCCLIDASGIFGKQDCCAKERSTPAPSPQNCGQPCGVLAVASYFPPQSQVLVFAPSALTYFDVAEILTALQDSVCINPNFPAAAPPELIRCWQFSFRTALSPRAPSFVS